MAMLHHAVAAWYVELEAIPLAFYRPYQVELTNL